MRTTRCLGSTLAFRSGVWAWLLPACLLACSNEPEADAKAKAQPTGGLFDSKGGLDASLGLDLGSADSTADVPKFGTGDAAPTQDLQADDSDPAATDVSESDSEVAASAGKLGAPCEEPGACDSGLCVESASGKVCSAPCTDSCPTGFVCSLLATASGDVIYACLPRFARLCDPCAVASDCNANGLTGNLCVDQGGLGSFCGVGCTPGATAACPSGFACNAVVDAKSGKASHQCQPKSNACTCSPAAVQKQLATACKLSNPNGVCPGTRGCAEGTLSACDAQVPAGETCNGKDDNCNGQTDDVGTQGCQVKNEHGTCTGKVTGCSSGQDVCDAKVPAPESCNGLDDDCDGQTDEGLCEDGSPCTAGACNPDGSCQQKPLTGLACDDGNVCSGQDKCAAGQCQGSAAQACDDNNPCTADGCDPLSGCVHTAQDAACADDGNPCTLDQCQAGKCNHPPAPSGQACPDDGKPCTQDICQGSVCAHPPSSTGLACPDDGDGCTTDACDGKGACSHPILVGFCSIKGASGAKCVAAGSTDPKAPCMVCNPSASTSAYVLQEGLLCDDGDACSEADVCKGGVCKGKAKDCSAKSGTCTTGACEAGVCVAKPKSGLCNDGDACTTSDVCDGGVCGGKPKDCAYIGTACTQGTCEAGQCLAKPKPGACNDNNACTVEDSCEAGACKGKTKDCSGLNDACHVGVCSLGGCIAQPKSGPCDDGDGCTTNDSCVAGTCKGSAVSCSALNDSCNTGVCQGGGCVKQPKASTAFCSDGNACTSGDHCEAGSCKGTPVVCAGDACQDGVCQSGFCSKVPKATGTTCNDGDSCTQSDQCAGGVCKGSAVVCPGEGCYDGICQAGQCAKKPKPIGTSCNDGDVCTQSDTCSFGVCKGTALSCSALSDVCNDGVCLGGTCAKKAKASGTSCSDGESCSSGDTCQAGVCKGTPKDCSALSDPCNDGQCSFGSCVKKAKATGTLCSDGSTCTVNDKCSLGVCSGTSTADSFEPNNSSPGKSLQTKSDCDDASSLTATMSPSGDTDWYTYTATDNSFCTIKPNVGLKSLAADYDVCLFFQCGNGKTGEGTVSCNDGVKTSGGPAGSWGCCSTASGTVAEFAKVSPACSFLGTGNEGGTVSVRVTTKASAVCGGYTLEWSAKN